MKRAATLVLRRAEVRELIRICDTGDAAAALVFARRHLRDTMNQLLDGG